MSVLLPVDGRHVRRARAARPLRLLLLDGGEGQRAGRLEHGVARGADGAELAEDGEADGAHEANVDELAVAEAGGAVVHLFRRREAQRLPEGRVGEEQPDQELEADGKGSPYLTVWYGGRMTTSSHYIH